MSILLICKSIVEIHVLEAKEIVMEVMLNTIANIHIFLEKTNWQNGDWSWVGISPWSSKKMTTLSMFPSADNFSKNK